MENKKCYNNYGYINNKRPFLEIAFTNISIREYIVGCLEKLANAMR
jgi:hypothetical protein